ncbi:hypothetical protein [Mycobacterium sp. ENV421]|uniref:hypothetical protein n=1 Tax=Mycobacterium sp. ENV421 TaxID=1213407 RepID=UPI001304A5C4|nr:hypothetical protein [Mycobacterium sp. ENV421]
MTFEWTDESRFEAARNALAYITFLHTRPAGSDMTEANNLHTAMLNDLTDAGADSDEAMALMYSGNVTVMNLVLHVAAQRSGLSVVELLGEVGVLLNELDS